MHSLFLRSGTAGAASGRAARTRCTAPLPRWRTVSARAVVVGPHRFSQEKASRPQPPHPAVKEFTGKFKSKTGTAWDNRSSIVPKIGKYAPVDMADDDEEEDADGDTPMAPAVRGPRRAGLRCLHTAACAGNAQRPQRSPHVYRRPPRARTSPSRPRRARWTAVCKKASCNRAKAAPRPRGRQRRCAPVFLTPPALAHTPHCSKKLVQLIFEKDMFKESMESFNLDVKKVTGSPPRPAAETARARAAPVHRPLPCPTMPDATGQD